MKKEKGIDQEKYFFKIFNIWNKIQLNLYHLVFLSNYATQSFIIKKPNAPFQMNILFHYR